MGVVVEKLGQRSEPGRFALEPGQGLGTGHEHPPAHRATDPFAALPEGVVEGRVALLEVCFRGPEVGLPPGRERRLMGRPRPLKGILGSGRVLALEHSEETIAVEHQGEGEVGLGVRISGVLLAHEPAKPATPCRHRP